MSLNFNNDPSWGTNCVSYPYPSTSLYPHYSYRAPRIKRVTVVSEFDEKGKKVKETRTEEWDEGSSYYPYFYANGTATYGTMTNAAGAAADE